MSETLIGERVGLEAMEEGYWLVYFAAFPIAVFDSRALAVGALPESIGGWKSGNLKSGDSQIPTAATATTGSPAKNDNQNPGPKVLPLCPV